MTDRNDAPATGGAEAGGLEALFLHHRADLLRFLLARGAGDAAQDILQELWLKLRAAPARPVASPLSYFYRAADTLMIDRYRSEAAARRREHVWSEVAGPGTEGRSDAPAGERVLIARQQAVEAQAVLSDLGDRAARIFRRHRLDGVAQRDVAREEGVSLSTVESDLRRAARALLSLRERWHDD